MEQLNRLQRRHPEKDARKNNNRKNDQSSCQIIWSEPKYIMIGKYLTAKGLLLLKQKSITKEEAWFRYGKNRYKVNPNAKMVKVITHKVYHTNY